MLDEVDGVVGLGLFGRQGDDVGAVKRLGGVDRVHARVRRFELSRERLGAVRRCCRRSGTAHTDQNGRIVWVNRLPKRARLGTVGDVDRHLLGAEVVLDHVLDDRAGLLVADDHNGVRLSGLDLRGLRRERGCGRVVGDLTGDRGTGARERRLEAAQESLAVVGGLSNEFDVGMAGCQDHVGERLGLQSVRRSRAEVVAMVWVVGQNRAGVGRRALHHWCGRDLVDHRKRVAGGGSADDGVDLVLKKRVRGLGHDAWLGGAFVGTDLGHRLAVDSAGRVDVLQRECHAIAHRRLEERERAGVREQHAEFESCCCRTS